MRIKRADRILHPGRFDRVHRAPAAAIAMPVALEADMKKFIPHALLFLLISAGLPFAAEAGGGYRQVHGYYYGPPAYYRPYPYAYVPRAYYAPPRGYGYRHGYRQGYGHRGHGWHRQRDWRGHGGWNGYGGYGGYGGPRSGFSFYFSN